MATYLVTGGCGFIGSHLVDALMAGGHGVRVLDDLSTGRRDYIPAGAAFIEGDVADAATVAEAFRGVDGCFHLAAIASVERGNREWLATNRTNLVGAITVLETARSPGRRQPVPVVYASSAAVYGNNPAVPLQETADTGPLSAYGADKLGCELHATVAGRVHGVPTCGLRFFNVYGPRQDPNSPYSGVISIFCNRLADDRTVTIFGDGTQTRDFVFVADVVEALQRAMAAASTAANVFNVCTGRATSVFRLAETVAAILGVEPDIRWGEPRVGDIRHSLGSPVRARLGLGFEARTPLRDGLATTVWAPAERGTAPPLSRAAPAAAAH